MLQNQESRTERHARCIQALYACRCSRREAMCTKQRQPVRVRIIPVLQRADQRMNSLLTTLNSSVPATRSHSKATISRDTMRTPS